MITTTTTAPILTPTAIQYKDEVERTQYVAQNAAFCAAFNNGAAYNVMLDIFPDGMSERPALYYALVCLEDGPVLPLPLFEQAAGVKFNPPCGEYDEFDPEQLHSWLVTTFPGHPTPGLVNRLPEPEPEPMKLVLPEREQEFLADHVACGEAREWLATGQYPTLEAAWQVCQRGDWMRWLLRETNTPDAIWRHLAVDFAEKVRHLMTDEQSLNALRIARRYADGQATDEELSAANVAASAAAWAADTDTVAAAAWAAYYTTYGAAYAAEACAYVTYAARHAAEAARTFADAARAAEANLIRARVPHAPVITANPTD